MNNFSLWKWKDKCKFNYSKFNYALDCIVRNVVKVLKIITSDVQRVPTCVDIRGIDIKRFNFNEYFNKSVTGKYKYACVRVCASNDC